MALTLLSAWPTHASDDDDDHIGGPSLHIPGLPPIQLPPGVRAYGPDGDYQGQSAPRRGPDTELGGQSDVSDRAFGGRGTVRDSYGGTVIGPGGVVKPPIQTKRAASPPLKKPPTLEEKQAQIRKALAPKPPLAVARRHTLDDLYGKLAAAKDEDESKGLASLISAIWMRSGSDTADLLMARADKAIGDKKYPLAIQVLDRVVALQPAWAEAWNKRAAARYLDGDLNGSMADVDHVLKLEPKHFAALSGMAMILQRTGFDRRALEVYRRELAIYPHQPEVEKIVEKLTLSVEGQGI